MTFVLSHPKYGTLIATDTRTSAHFPNGTVVRRDYGGKLLRTLTGWVTVTSDAPYYCELVFRSLVAVPLHDRSAIASALQSAHAAFGHTPRTGTVRVIAHKGRLAGSFGIDGKSQLAAGHWGVTIPMSMPIAEYEKRGRDLTAAINGAKGMADLVRAVAAEFSFCSAHPDMSAVMDVAVGRKYMQVGAAELHVATDAEIRAWLGDPPAPATHPLTRMERDAKAAARGLWERWQRLTPHNGQSIPKATEG